MEILALALLIILCTPEGWMGLLILAFLIMVLKP